MKTCKHTVTLVLLMAMLLLPVSAQERTVDPTTQFCFSAEDFLSQQNDLGVFLTAVPNSATASIHYGNRTLKAGDALPREALNHLTLDTTCTAPQSISIEYCTVSDGAVSVSKALTLSIQPRKNEPPVAEDGKLETYRNIAQSGTLSASDPENGVLVYKLKTPPKRGTVEIREDGTFTYSPKENKVGKDQFTFTATDDAGNTSASATISIVIKKPTDQTVYVDMQGDKNAFVAMWMKDEGLFRGNTVAGNLCFEPDAPVSRGEFLVMAMKLVDAQANHAQMTSGFADEAETPIWMQPYIVSALSNGMISGVQEEDGIRFQPTATLTHAEAAVMLQNILQLPKTTAQPVFSSEEEATTPVWAQSAVAALASAGISMDTTAEDFMTRREVANLFYQVHQFLDQKTIATFYWNK